MGDKPFEERVEALEKLFAADGPYGDAPVTLVTQTRVKNLEHMQEMLSEVQQGGGEGLMLRQPESKYDGKRSSTLLKVKTFHDAEARVTGFTKGKGRNAGVIGALECVMASGKASPLLVKLTEC